MKIGHLVYHDTTECEFINVLECVSKVWQHGFDDPPENLVIGVTPEITGWTGVVIRPHAVFSDVDLSALDLLVVPGGQASRTVRYNADVIDWLQGWDRSRPIASCCSGALVLAEAGFLAGRRATTHCLAMPTLAEYPDVTVVKERVVEDDGVITAGGILASIDLGLYLVERFWGPEARRVVAHQNEYRDLERFEPAHALLPELDGWYRGGHVATHRRPGDWREPSRA